MDHFNSLRKLVWTLVPLTAILAGCASSTPQDARADLLPELDLLQVREDAQASLQISRQLRLDVEALHARVSQVEKQISQLSAAMASIGPGRNEELSSRLSYAEEEIRSLRKECEGWDKVPTVLSPQGTRKVRPRLPGEPDAYSAAMSLYDAGNFAGCEEAFNRFVTEQPNATWSDEGWFWLGECRAGRGDYASALQAYQRVFSFLETDKGDDAQYRSAMAYLQIGDTRQALAEFKKLAAVYPDSEYIVRANHEISRLQARQSP